MSLWRYFTDPVPFLSCGRQDITVPCQKSIPAQRCQSVLKGITSQQQGGGGHHHFLPMSGIFDHRLNVSYLIKCVIVLQCNGYHIIAAAWINFHSDRRWNKNSHHSASCRWSRPGGWTLHPVFQHTDAKVPWSLEPAACRAQLFWCKGKGILSFCINFHI